MASNLARDVESILALDPKDTGSSAHASWPRRFVARELGWYPHFDLDRTDGHGLYGGQVIAQTVWAACHTVPPGFDVHSTHGHFLRPGDSTERISYDVHEVRTGRNYAVRRIEAVQSGKVMYTSFASFKRGFAAQPEHQDRSIRHGTPYPTDSFYPPQDAISSLPINPDVDLPGLRDFVSLWEMPIEFRKLPMDETNATVTEVHERRQVHFLRPRYVVHDKTHNFAAVALMYASDRNFLFTATNAHVVSSDLSFANVASLDHAFIVHRTLGSESVSPLDPRARKAGEGDSESAGLVRNKGGAWVTYDSRSPAAGNERCLTTGLMWDSDGRHVATVTQEAMSQVTVVGPASKL